MPPLEQIATHSAHHCPESANDLRHSSEIHPQNQQKFMSSHTYYLDSPVTMY